MPNVTITIGTPVLVAGEHFKVRYRLLPNGSFSAPQNKTNAPFTLTGLSAGSYELEVIVVKSDGSECPPTYQIFEVVTPFECIDFTAEMIIAANGLAYLTISYTLPGGFTDPACGWDIIYNGNKVHYATLPASPIQILLPNNGVALQVIADNCNGNRSECFNDDIPPATPVCIPMTGISATIQVNPLSTQANPNFNIFVHYTQSNPCTTSSNIQGQQVNILPGGGPPATFNFLNAFLPCFSSSFGWGVAPNTNIQWQSTPGGEKKHYEFQGTITDVCGQVHQWSCFIDY